ncbi:6330_t:CDS:2 [Cetraspora pellucida]|uniref:6330_t:CDS:1 n=1 Tax=Cetraspora pellucida TaxID=1433469 RepID=A0A9N8VLM3_9GLOM|nr:6330_t:CDS:2 [Cetraspora pellucida]
METNESNLRKRNINLEEEIEDSSESEEEYMTSSSNLESVTKNKKSRQFSEIWSYYIKGAEKSHGHYEATCYYCLPKKFWARGKPAKLEAHLANECSNCPEHISQYWRDKVAERSSNYTRKKNVLPSPAQPSITSHFSSNHLLPKATEIVRINCAIDKEIDKADYLTLEAITNQEIVSLISNEDFFITCRLVRSIWQPIKEIIYALEANEATLADCFAYLIGLAVAIERLSEMNTFKTSAINIFNRRYEEFLHPLYLLAYYIHPQYRGKGLKDNGFRKAALTSLELWQNLGHTRLEGTDIPKIWWGYEEDQISVNDETSLDNITSNYSTTLLIEEIIDLGIENLESSVVEMAHTVLAADLDYDPCDVLNNFLECEKQSK